MDILIPKNPEDAEQYLHDLFFIESFRQEQLGKGPSPLDRMSKTAVEKMLVGHDGQGGLMSEFPLSIQCLIEQNVFENPIDMLHQYLASNEFNEHSNYIEYKEGLCLEESFYLFLKKTAPNLLSASSYQNEFYDALFKVLALHTDPSFNIKSSSIHRTEDGWISIQNFSVDQNQETPFTLFMIHQGKYIQGPITTLVALILQMVYLDLSPEDEKALEAYPPEAIQKTLHELAKMGLIEME